MSLDWTSSQDTMHQPNYQDEPWQQRPGEVFGEPRPYSPFTTPIGLNYAHVCGTPEEFVDGAFFDPDADVKYDEQGLPVCCGGPIVPVFPLVVGFELMDAETPAPGTACATAPEVELGIWYVWEVSGGPMNLFWAYEGLTPGADYRMRGELLGPTPVLGEGGIPGNSFGPTCTNFTPTVSGTWNFFTQTDYDQTRTLTGADRIVFRFDGVVTVPFSFRFRVDPA